MDCVDVESVLIHQWRPTLECASFVRVHERALRGGAIAELHTISKRIQALPPSVRRHKRSAAQHAWHATMPTRPSRDPWYRLLTCKNPSALTKIEVQGNELAFIPDLTAFRRLSKLHLGRNILTTLPCSIGQLQTLTVLHLGHNHFEHLPPAIAGLGTTLTALHLFHNRLVDLDGVVIAALPRLVTLNLNHNALVTLPSAVGGLVHLESLSATHNQLVALPDNLGGAVALTELIVTSNRLRRLPHSLGQLKNLRRCVVVGNCMAALPGQLLQCPKLVELDFASNEIPFFTGDTFQALCKLPRFHIEGNRFVRPLPPFMESLVGALVPSLREVCSRQLYSQLPDAPDVAPWEGTDAHTRALRKRGNRCPVCSCPLVDHYLSTVRYVLAGGSSTEKVPIEAKLCSYACLVKKKRHFFVTELTLRCGQYAFRAVLPPPPDVRKQVAPATAPRRRSRLDVLAETLPDMLPPAALPVHWSSPPPPSP